LRFVEAKHFSNKEIWSNAVPPVIEQIQRYEKQIPDRRGVILAEYAQYIAGVNQIFGLSLKPPTGVDEKVTLLIFGFDNDQKKGERFKTLVWDKAEFNPIPKYAMGNSENLNASTIWNKAKT
jgi:hypothetical protein